MIELSMRRLLIHTCCADCLLNAIANLEEKRHISQESEITLLFYNPNIHPRSEYIERLKAVQKIIPKIAEDWNVKLVVPEYSPKQYMDCIKEGSEKYGERCLKCWEIRLEYSLRYAKNNEIENITTTLLTSHYQSRDIILKILKKLNKKYNINTIEINECSNENHSGFYKQNYCGCCFSLVEKMTNERI